MSGRIDPQQRRECYRQIDWFRMSAVSSGLEGKTIKSQRDVRIVGINSHVICFGGARDREGSRNTEHVPSSQRGIAVLKPQPSRSVGNIPSGKLRTSVVVA